jgi:hypothetical protein
MLFRRVVRNPKLARALKGPREYISDYFDSIGISRRLLFSSGTGTVISKTPFFELSLHLFCVRTLGKSPPSPRLERMSDSLRCGQGRFFFCG